MSADGAAAQRLSRGASGLRHLRWAREVLATLEAHVEHNTALSGADHEALQGEASALAAAVQALSGAVKRYRDFLERTRVRYRGRVRVAEYLVRESNAGEAGGTAHAHLGASRAHLEEALVELTWMEQAQRQPLKAALSAEIDRLRDAMARMDAHLAGRLSGKFVESLYPPLTDGATRVADDGDPDDDATSSPR
ncbi:hypothetical protein ACSRUE_39630 [Sorangium sp. KYC3313]|uniref:hypothetical protein n=1 Tax=Sorangium sp. KYC3313 TaxID=3449740 RepID=UPI003F8A2C5C